MESDASLSDAPFLEQYRTNAQETERERCLLKLLGSGETALDIGTLDGIQQCYRGVVAFDLESSQRNRLQDESGARRVYENAWKLDSHRVCETLGLFER